MLTTLREALGAIVEPQVGATARRARIPRRGGRGGGSRVELVLPVSEWPHRALPRGRASPRSPPGATVVVRAMDEDERLALRNYLRGAMTSDAGAGQHDHADASPRFLDRLSKTRVLGISSGKGGVGKSSVTVNLAIALAARGSARRACSTPTSTASPCPRCWASRPTPSCSATPSSPRWSTACAACRWATSCPTSSRSSGADRCCTRRSSSWSPRRGGTSPTSC